MDLGTAAALRDWLNNLIAPIEQKFKTEQRERAD
jgi:hypothetical protein